MSDPMAGPASGAGGTPGAEGAGPPAPGDTPEQGPLGVPREPTGNAEVDARLARLAAVDHLATDGHTEVYEDVQHGLREILDGLDAGPHPPAHDHRS